MKNFEVDRSVIFSDIQRRVSQKMYQKGDNQMNLKLDIAKQLVCLNNFKRELEAVLNDIDAVIADSELQAHFEAKLLWFLEDLMTEPYRQGLNPDGSAWSEYLDNEDNFGDFFVPLTTKIDMIFGGKQ